MELLYLLMFLVGWFVCWTQMSRSRYLTQEQSDYLMQEWLADSEQWKSEYQQLELKYQRAQETVVAQELEILKLSEKVTGQERELDLLRYRI